MRFSCYQINTQHRNGKTNKSQWIVDEITELEIFLRGFKNGWTDSKKQYIWSFFQTPFSSIIGSERSNNNSSQKSLYMAKFSVDNNNTWHGYPISSYLQADHPPQTLVNKWMETGTVNKKEYNKWVKGKLR